MKRIKSVSDCRPTFAQIQPPRLKTYAEMCGVEPFDWQTFLIRNDISEEEWNEAERRAGDWITCSCGIQCASLPRADNGCPEDFVLITLGGERGFFKAIKDRDNRAALHFLDLIEKRSAYLLTLMREQVIKDREVLNQRAAELGMT